MVVITSVATDTRAVGQAAAIAIGGTIGLEALFAGPISGASMNPARSLAPAIVSWTWQDQWLYVAGPAIGAVAGVFIYNWVRGGEKPDGSRKECRMTTRIAIFSDLHGNSAATEAVLAAIDAEQPGCRLLPRRSGRLRRQAERDDRPHPRARHPDHHGQLRRRRRLRPRRLRLRLQGSGRGSARAAVALLDARRHDRRRTRRTCARCCRRSASRRRASASAWCTARRGG